MDDIIFKQHAKLGPKKTQRMRAALLGLHEVTNGILSCGTGCSGTDVLVLILDKLTQYWDAVFGVKFVVQHAWSCDKGFSIRFKVFARCSESRKSTVVVGTPSFVKHGPRAGVLDRKSTR